MVSPRRVADPVERCYGIGYPVQVGPKKAALFCNVRILGAKCQDYEDGAEVFVFDDLSCVGKGGSVPVTWNEKEKDEQTGEPRFIVKYPPAVGFWPAGAKRSDGSVHPGAGKGFALCQALSFIGGGEELPWRMYSQKGLKHYVEVMQLAFDGQHVSVVKRECIRTGQKWETADGWGLRSPGLQPAIPDGNDLLMAMTAAKKGAGGTGVCRFRFSEGLWQQVAFTRVAGGAEPSLARRADGTFIFTTRSGEKDNSKSIELWAAKDAGGPWTHHLRVDNVRNATPVSVHATPDGRIFVLANHPGVTSRDGKVRWPDTLRSQLALWQLAQGAAEFLPQRPRLIRDCLEEFGMLEDCRWYVDHPVSATVQLGDGLWHGLVAYRVMAFPVNSDKVRERLTPHTGCYVEEVRSAQPAQPPWRF